MFIKVTESEILNVSYTVNIIDMGEIRAWKMSDGNWLQLYEFDKPRENEAAVRSIKVNFSDRDEAWYYYGKEAELIWKWYESMVITDLTLDKES